jgi:phenylacetate-CoA ligase
VLQQILRIIISMSGISDITTVVQVAALLKIVEKTQFTHIPKLDLIKSLPIMTRRDLQTKNMPKGAYTCRTSGSTGEPVTIEKTHMDRIWTYAINIRDYRWRGWDPTKNVALIKPNLEAKDIDSWGLPTIIEPKQGRTYKLGYRPISEIQAWLEFKNPHYIICAPSILASIDLTKLSNFLAWRGTGEKGGTTYSSEECGIISIQCPSNPEVHHVMENQIVETDEQGALIISTMTNDYIRRYKHGDYVTLGHCSCGRSLQTIQEIKGRVRNMFTMSNGDRRWPLVGSLGFYDKYGIKQFKIIQIGIGRIEAHLCYDNDFDKSAFIQDIRAHLEERVEVSIIKTDKILQYKSEEFISMIP